MPLSDGTPPGSHRLEDEGGSAVRALQHEEAGPEPLAAPREGAERPRRVRRRRRFQGRQAEAAQQLGGCEPGGRGGEDAAGEYVTNSAEEDGREAAAARAGEESCTRHEGGLETISRGVGSEEGEQNSRI